MTTRTHLIHNYSYQLMDLDEFFPILKEYRSIFIKVMRKRTMYMRSGFAKPSREALELIGYSVPELKD